MNNTKTYHALGLMSGSSLDGLDLAFCKIEVEQAPKFKVKSWQLVAAETVPFSEQWIARLAHLPQQNALVFAKTNVYFGHYCGQIVVDFLKKIQLEPDFIASHGHTIFHLPDNRVTVQIGDGAAIAATTGYPVICDFRTTDIAINGEGTPLAPLADKYLFNGYDFYLNIGGIANISANIVGEMIAFDIAPANQVLNFLANELDLPYDENGAIAASGKVNAALLAQVENFEFFTKKYPKSLDNNWIRENIFPLYVETDIPMPDRLRTGVEHLAKQIAKDVLQIIDNQQLKKEKYTLLATGGGTFNGFLLDQVQAKIPQVEIQLPPPEIIEFKEALLMALLGVLRVENEVNCLRSVTGAERDTINGAIYQGAKKWL